MANVVVNSKSFNPSQDLTSIDNAIWYLKQPEIKQAMEQQLRNIMQPYDVGSENVVNSNTANVVMPEQMSYTPQVSDLMLSQPEYTPSIDITQTPEYQQLMSSISQTAQQPVVNKAVAPQVNQTTTPTVSANNVASTTTKPTQGTFSLEDLITDIRRSVGEPVSSTGKTSTLYDMLRGVAAVNAPQVSAIMEQKVKGLQDTETARVKAEAELEKQTLDLQGKILLEQAKKGSARDANYYFSKSNSQVLYTTPTPEQLADPRLKSRIIETSDGQKVIQVKQINANDPNVQKLHLWNNMMKIQDGAVDMMNKFGLTPDMILTKSPLITQIAKTPEFKAWHNSLGRAFQEYRTAKTGAQASDKEIERLKPLMPTGEEKDIATLLANLIQIQKEASVSNEAILDGFQALGYDVNGLSTMLYQPRTLAQSQEQSTDWNAEKEARYQELLKKQGGGK